MSDKLDEARMSLQYTIGTSAALAIERLIDVKLEEKQPKRPYRSEGVGV